MASPRASKTIRTIDASDKSFRERHWRSTRRRSLLARWIRPREQLAPVEAVPRIKIDLDRFARRLHRAGLSVDINLDGLGRELGIHLYGAGVTIEVTVSDDGTVLVEAD